MTVLQHRITLFLLALVLGPNAGRWTCQAESKSPLQYGRVKVIALDSFGVPAIDVRVVQFSDKSDHDLATLFHDQLAENIPFGEYKVRVTTKNDGPLFQRVLVNQRDSLIVFARNPLHFNHAAKLPVLLGTVKSGFGGEKVPSWVKLCGIFLDGCLTSTVAVDRTFSFSDLTPGTYFIWLFDAYSRDLVSGRTDIHNVSGTIILDPAAPNGEQVAGSH